MVARLPGSPHQAQVVDQLLRYALGEGALFGRRQLDRHQRGLDTHALHIETGVSRL